VVEVEGSGRIRTATGREQSFDVLVGADGAGSLVRRTFVGPTPAGRLMMAAGWFAPGDAPMTVRFTPGLAGYLWLFPRQDHVGVGICAPLGAVPTRRMLALLEHEIGASFPRLRAGETRRYAHTIPSPSADPGSLLGIAGRRWALVGDAAALADPITGEGIYYALRSAQHLADTLQSFGSAERYPTRLLDDCGRELLRAAALHERFYAPGFSRRVIRYGARSTAIREILADLVLGEQGYVGLKGRLVRALPRFLWDSLAAGLSGGSAGRP
jgi:flavin-dependent dehydrogenase